MTANMLEPVQMNDFRRQWEATSSAVLGAVRSVGESGWYVLGREVSGFESALAARIGVRHAIGCANGLDAIELGLRAKGLRPGQKVLTTPLSAFATTLAILRAGGVPVFVDVDATGLVDLDRAAALLEQDSSIRFFVPVHLFGHALDLDQLQEMTQRYQLVVLEDCCQAVGARSRGRAVGTVGAAGALSFYPTKNLGAMGDGGAVITEDEAVAASCRSLRDYGQTAKYVHEVAGLNSRLDELHAAILSAAYLPHLPEWTARRRDIAGRYLEGIRSEVVRPLPAPDASDSVWHLFPVRIAPELRAAFMGHLRTHGIQSAIHYPHLITDQRALSGVAFEIHGPLDNARALADGEVSLPIHPYLTDAEVERVIDTVDSFRSP